ncbi:MAG: SsrA-binding protein SmpB [bacterium]|jgi:SsrA-binding protein|nr:SsrA-binding protein SmpB [bacterium]
MTKKKPAEEPRYIAQNRKARHDYQILQTWEAGIALCGTEVKSCREGHASLKEAWARVVDGEIFVMGMHISPYAKGTVGAHDETRMRKLLLHASEIRKIAREVEGEGRTLVPLALYWKKHLVKCRLALVAGKRQADKRTDIAKREVERDLKRIMKERNQR